MKTEKNPRCLANLKPFKAGAEWKGNAGGRPKRLPLSEALEAIYANPKEAMAAAKAMARKIRKGDTKAFSELANRIEGKVTTHQDRAEQTVCASASSTEIDGPTPPDLLCVIRKVPTIVSDSQHEN